MMIEDLNCGDNIHFKLDNTFDGRLKLIAFDPLKNEQKTIYMKIMVKGKGHENDHIKWVKLGKILEISAGEEELKKIYGHNVDEVNGQ